MPRVSVHCTDIEPMGQCWPTSIANGVHEWRPVPGHADRRVCRACGRRERKVLRWFWRRA